MASGIRPTSNNHFEAYYEAPWGGVASDEYATDLQPNQFVACTGLAIRNGRLCSEFWSPNNTSINWTLPVGSYIVAVTTINGTLVVFDQLGNSYLNQIGTGGLTSDQSYGSAVEIDCLKVINGIAYLFDFMRGQSYAYTPTVSYVLNSTYVGGKYCAVIDGYLLTANSNQPTDTPTVKTGRVNWSAPYQFGTWDPSVNRQAGYNVLADVEDEITGIFAIANVGFVLRTNGITQLTPIGIAIQPFDFPTQASGDFGIGCSYPDTLAVFGNNACFGDSTNFYFFSGSAPQEICGVARDAIYADINSLYNRFQTGVVSSTVSGTFSNSSYNNITPELTYTICITQRFSNLAGRAPIIELIFWTYNVMHKTWVRNTFNLGAYISSLYATEGSQPIVGAVAYSKLIHVKYPIATNLNSKRPAFTFPVYIFSASITGGTNPGLVSVVLNMFQCLNGATGEDTTLPAAFNLQFRQEEVKIRRQPTINFVTFRASGYGTINVQVGNATFTPVTIGVSPTQPATWQTYTSSGICTQETPQLILTSTNFYGTVNKVMMECTYADGDLG